MTSSTRNKLLYQMLIFLLILIGVREAIDPVVVITWDDTKAVQKGSISKM